MATWTKKPPNCEGSRRKWNLEDRASLNNLKYHFASDGCSDVQYGLGRQLLETDADADSSHVKGVHWLLLAAQQGHEKSLEMLRQCYKNKRGITDANEDEVKSCLFMTAGERGARKAARELFACLSNGGDTITPSQLERKMRKIYKLQRKRTYSNSSSSEWTQDEEDIKEPITNHINSANYSTDESLETSRAQLDLQEENLITEANLVNAAVNYSRGRMPLVNGNLTLSIPHSNTLDHIPIFHRIILHPIIFFTLLYHRFVRIISSFPGSTISNIKLLGLFIVYALISSENLTIFLPLVAYYATLLIMIWSSFKMLKTKHDFIDFRIWSGLFLIYGNEHVDARTSENLFLKNNMEPYLYFFGAFIANMIIYPVISSEWLPYSEITVISFIMVFITMFVFMYTSPYGFPDVLILISFAVNVLAKYPYETDSVVATSWRFLDLKVPTFCSFVIGNGIEFCLNCRAVLYLLIPGFMIHLAKRSRWHGIYTYLIPHCITICWLQICITSSQSATMFGLLRAALGLAGIMLFLPLFGIITLMIPIFVVIDWLGLTDLKVRLATAITIGLLGLLISCFMAMNVRTQKYITVLQVALSFGAAVILSLPHMTTNFNTELTETSLYQHLVHESKPVILPNQRVDDEDLLFTWEKYYNLCSQPAWETSNKIKTQLRCSQLDGTKIRWEGNVVDIRIFKIMNYRAELIKNYLPTWIGNLITCYYGEKNFIKCDSTECEKFQNLVRFKCNLNKWNSYEYQIKIRMVSGLLSKPVEIYLQAGNSFGNFSTELRTSDRIWFKGFLINHRRVINENIAEDIVLGGGHDSIQLTGIGCISCQNTELRPIEIKTRSILNGRLKDLMRGCKYLLNVLFNPLIIFK